MPNARKLFIADNEHPWITWDKDLYKLQEKHRGTADCLIDFYGIELVVSPWEADLFWLNRDAVDLDDPVFEGKDVFLFFDEIQPNQQHELGVLADIKRAHKRNWTVVTESISAEQKFSNVGLANEVWFWRRPSRIDTQRMITEVPLSKREDRIVSVFDAGHPLGHAADLVKAFLGAFMWLRDDHDIEPELHIFSHTELPFEPFNDIIFHGFQQPKKVMKEVAKAKLAIWSPETEKYPNMLVEAAQLGVPTMQYRPTGSTLEIQYPFYDLGFAHYTDVDDLTNKIIEHFVESKKNVEFLNDRIMKCKSRVIEEDTEFGLHIFLSEMSRRLHGDV